MLYLSQQEKQALLFLAVIYLSGMGIQAGVKKFCRVEHIGVFADVIGKVNINTADQAGLMEIPGVGAVLAGRIIEYRRERGFFRSVEDLRRVRGITQGRFNALQDSCRVQ